MKTNGSSWKFALIFLSGIIIAAQLLLIIHWRWRFWQNEHWQTKLPPQWEAVDPSITPLSPSLSPPLSPSLSPPLSPPLSPFPSSNDGPAKRVFVGGNSTRKQPAAGHIVQELICPRRRESEGDKGQPRQQEGCYAVVDGPSQFGSGFARALMVELHGTLMPLSESDLNFPLHYQFTRENARQWPVLTNKITVDFLKLIVAQPFITQTFKPSMTPWKVPDGKTRRILCLGLRGSAVNNFFVNLSTKYDVTVVEPEPALSYIVRKWFGFEESEHHRILVENPAFYVTARSRLIEHPKFATASRFNFIVVDLCNDGISAKGTAKCPIGEFTEEKLVRELSTNLAEDGTISVNIFSLDSKSDIPAQHQLANAEHRLLQLYQRYFGHCHFVSLGANLILTCSRKEPEMTRLRYHLGQRKLPKELQMFKGDEEPKFFLDLEAI